MLRPERMSRVSVTGSKAVMDDVIETVHDLHLLHLSDYDGSWEGFQPGDPIGGADEVSEKLVTVRALESILEVDEEDAGAVDLDDAEARLEAIRREVNDLDDRRDGLEAELREVEELLDALAPLAELGIDLDLLGGYESLQVAVGEGDEAAVRAALEAAGDVRAFELFSGGDVVAAFAAPEEGAPEDAPEDALEEALVGVAFSELEVPAVEEVVDVDDASPGAYVEALEARREQLTAKLEDVESELGEVRREAAGFLLTLEERLSIQVQKREAPLSFATTERSFVAEGWIPTPRFVALAEALESAVGDRVDLEELERADYDRDGHVADREPVGDVPGEPTAADGGAAADGSDPGAGDGSDPAGAGDDSDPDREPAADGGLVTMGDEEPPVLQDNPRPVEPFELLTEAVGRPKYTELDPTIVLFLTFPLMFGFMIGDVGYGVIYTAIGYYVYTAFESETFENFGYVATAAGVFTVLFGVLYGEIFGLHLVTDVVWEPLLGHPPIEKGLSPATVEWAQAWFVVTALFGAVHLNVGFTFEFLEDYALHDLWEAMLESGSWLLALNGLWLFVFSRGPFGDTRPDLLFTVFARGEGAAFELGFTGLPVWTGWLGVAMVGVGVVLLVAGPTHEIIELHQVLAHVLSYLRIAAVLLAKAGMAFAVNLLFFGAYEEHGEFHFMLTHGPEYVLEHTPEATIMFGGLVHGGIAAVVGGVAVLLIGHVVVLLLGVTSAGIQSIRLEYFEFFSKFYEGGGTPYSPFGYERRFTAEE